MTAWTRIALTASLVAVAGCTESEPDLEVATTDIWLVEIAADDAGRPVVGEPRNLTSRAGYDNQPAFVPGGGAFLYASGEGADVHVWRFDLERGEREPVTTGAGREYAPEPIPDHPGFSAIRVEEWGRQRLWRFEDDGIAAAPIFEWEPAVRDYVWVDSALVVLGIVLEDGTSELHFGDPLRGWVEREALATDIGRTLRRVPDGSAVSFEERTDDGAWITTIDLLTRVLTRRIRLPEGSSDHIWLTDGGLLSARDRHLLYCRPDVEDTWSEVAELSAPGIARITRLAFDPARHRLLFVASPRPRDVGGSSFEPDPEP